MSEPSVKWKEIMIFEDLPNEDMRTIASICGIEVVFKLMEHMPGLIVNVPKNGMKKVKERYIVDKYNGHNVKELAVVCGVSLRHVYNVINRSNNKK
ncbi:MAG TPA: Mor transcription activator family protein [bacterium]|nr:Mor transcription activator family protein [bacterium]